MNSDKVILKKDLRMLDYQYHDGDIFTIIGDSYLRGWDLRHDKTGNVIYECRFLQKDFEYYSIKDDRRDKLNKIDGKLSI